MDITQRIAANIRRYRLAKNLSQEMLAGMSGLHPNYISMVERGKRQITVVSLEKIANALNVELKDLIIRDFSKT